MKHTERGSALFYILIAIVLLAALSYAIARSSRGNVGQLSAERARLAATELLEYANVASNGVSQIKLRGVKADELCFDDPQATEDYDYDGCDDDYNKLYSVNGAGITWTRIPAETGADSEWHVYGDNEIKGIGTTCADEDCTELLLVARDIDKGVCMEINELLDILPPDTNPPTDNAFGTEPYKGEFNYTNTIGDAGSLKLDGQSAGCLENTSDGIYIFYKVLLSR